MPDEHRHHPWVVVRHMFSGAIAIVPLVAGALFLGMAIYHWVESLGWSDSFLNASMLLGGMGPVAPIQTTLGKWLVGSYALFAGLVVIVVAGALLAPVFHHVLQKHHLEMDAHSKSKPTRG